MKEYGVDKLRSLALLGHGGAGKTSLAEALLYDAGAIDRLGKASDGSTTMDYDPDEIARQKTISSSLGFCEWKKHKIMLIDTPGDANFISDTLLCMKGPDAVVVIVSAVSGVRVQTDKLWKNCDSLKKIRMVFINEMDHERADFVQALGSLEKAFPQKIVPLQIPIGQGLNFKGIVDLIEKKAYLFQNDLSGKFQEGEIPSDLKEEVEKYSNKMVELIAESDDELLEKYLETGELSQEEIKKTLRQGTIQGTVVPVTCGSAVKNIAVQPFLDIIVDYLPSPTDIQIIEGIDPKTKNKVTRNPSKDKAFSSLVFKTVADPYAGKLTIFRVYTGTLHSDSTVYNPAKETKERIGQIFALQGKNQLPLEYASTGDLVAVAKLKVTTTGDTLCDEKEPIIYEPVVAPLPVISFAIIPKSRGDEEKVSLALTRIMEEDPALKYGRDIETKEMIISGMGEGHLEVIVERMKRKFGVEVEVKTPKVPYKETIKGSAKTQGKYKRQSGGRGQYGDTWIEIEPLPKGQGFEFVDKIVGGVIPKQYIPAVEKGIVEAMEEGSLAGFQVVDIRVTLYDGSYHDVDSSEMAFKIAGSLGFKKAVLAAKPILLEPIMNMEIVVPDDCMGDVIGDLNSKRGKVIGVDSQAGGQVIKAQVPLVEVLKYSSGLRAMTGGRGSFTMEFSNYEEVPAHLAEKIIAEHKKEAE